MKDFSEEIHYACMLAIVGLLSTDATELGGETGYSANVFPYRNIDPSGHVTAIA